MNGDASLGLDEFISASLLSIVRGVTEAQEDSRHGGYIAPPVQGKLRNQYGMFRVKDAEDRPVTIVQFDVQVTARQASSGDRSSGVKGDIRVLSASLGSARREDEGLENVQRLTFAVPVEVPTRAG